MIIPVRCFTCNKVIGHLWEKYVKSISKYQESGLCETESTFKTLNELGLNLYCCRRMMLGHVDIIDNLLLFSNNDYEKEDPRAVQGIYDLVTDDDLNKNVNNKEETELLYSDEEYNDENEDKNEQENEYENEEENEDENEEENEYENEDENEDENENSDDDCIIEYDDE